MLFSSGYRFVHDEIDPFAGIIWQGRRRIQVLKLEWFSNLVEPSCCFLIHHVVRIFEAENSPTTLQYPLSLQEGVFRVWKIMKYSAENHRIVGSCGADPFVKICHFILQLSTSGIAGLLSTGRNLNHSLISV